MSLALEQVKYKEYAKWSYHSWNLVNNTIIGASGAYYHCIFCEWVILTSV